MQEENGLKDGGVIQNTPKLSQAQPHPKRHRASFHKHGVQKTMGARSPSAPPTPSQVLGGVEEQQGADRADVAGEPAQPLLSFVFRLWLGVHTHGEEFQLLLGVWGDGN